MQEYIYSKIKTPIKVSFLYFLFQLTDNMYVPEVIGKVVNVGSADTTFKLKKTSGQFERYTAILAVTSQNADLIGVYVIGVKFTGEAITKIAGTVDATIARSGDNVIVTFAANNIYSNGLLIAPRGYI